jgi:hypothetical protein
MERWVWRHDIQPSYNEQNNTQEDEHLEYCNQIGLTLDIKQNAAIFFYNFDQYN